MGSVCVLKENEGTCVRPNLHFFRMLRIRLRPEWNRRRLGFCHSNIACALIVSGLPDHFRSRSESGVMHVFLVIIEVKGLTIGDFSVVASKPPYFASHLSSGGYAMIPKLSASI